MLEHNNMNYLDKITSQYDRDSFLRLNEEISFAQYLERCHENPRLVRTAYQRIYDMIMAKGSHEFEKYRKTMTHYNFFDDPEIPIFGLEETLDHLVKFVRGAAGGYGTEKRILLLHGPVGSSKSTICRLLKRGLERYSQTPEGAWYSFRWVNLPTGAEGIYTQDCDDCPMHEEPLKLLPQAIRNQILAELNAVLREKTKDGDKNMIYTLKIDGEMDPRCKKFMGELLKRNNGDLKQVLTNHIVVVRKTHNEAERCGIATFQPKDEKNQDSTELTGDINFAKIAHFGSDSDARAFSFDGEFLSANRGLIEFIEMLKLDQAFLYDLLGASQERQVKPKKFSQIMVDEAIIGHSVHGETLIPHEYRGSLDVLPIEDLASLEVSQLRVFSVNPETHEVELSHVRRVFSHEFRGEWVENHQDGDVLVTTPNHSVYGTDYNTFYPGEDTDSDILVIDIPEWLVQGKETTQRWADYFKVAIHDFAGNVE